MNDKEFQRILADMNKLEEGGKVDLNALLRHSVALVEMLKTQLLEAEGIAERAPILERIQRMHELIDQKMTDIATSKGMTRGDLDKMVDEAPEDPAVADNRKELIKQTLEVKKGLAPKYSRKTAKKSVKRKGYVPKKHWDKA